MSEYANSTPFQARQMIRERKIKCPTSGISKGFIQANMAILPKKDAYDFLLFCQRNPKPCPLLEVLDAGSYTPKFIAQDADIRVDIPLYRIYKNGVLVGEVEDIKELWKDDFVTFLIGCSFSFENAMINKGIEVRHISDCHNVPMYMTNIKCNSAGIFNGNMVVSMRPIKFKDAVATVSTTARFPSVHGAPVHIGDPNFIGIEDINRPDFGDASTINSDEIPIFWACGVTPQSIALSSRPEIMITHSPGYMFIADKKDEDYSIF